MNLATRTRYLARRGLDVLLTPWRVWRERRLATGCRTWNRPRHIGLILDGNRRFARAVGLARTLDGHVRGAAKIRDLLGWCREFDIPMITIWIFSLDNFQRSSEEVEGLLAMIEAKIRELIADPDLRPNGLRLRFLGRREPLPASLREAIEAAEAATADLDRYQLNVAIAYGGREEITDAVRGCLRAAGDRPATEVAGELNEAAIAAHLYSAGLPDPDLVIRTSGERRLSGFMLWQAAYAEYHFCRRFWPEFRRVDFLAALHDYHQRQRRYGR